MPGRAPGEDREIATPARAGAGTRLALRSPASTRDRFWYQRSCSVETCVAVDERGQPEPSIRALCRWEAAGGTQRLKVLVPE